LKSDVDLVVAFVDVDDVDQAGGGLYDGEARTSGYLPVGEGGAPQYE